MTERQRDDIARLKDIYKKVMAFESRNMEAVLMVHTKEGCVGVLCLPMVVVSLSWSLPNPASELLSETLSS